MKQEITIRIEEYLYLDTNYAIIINGNYGIGKTHYIKNNLFPRITELEVPNSEKGEKFSTMLISLFGVKSIEDIQYQIFLELYPILKSKGGKIGAGVMNSVLKNFGNNLKDVLSEIGVTGTNSNHYRNFLICIDDIDRKANDLDLIEVFGFVNNLVENFGAKIILIANDDELRKIFEEKGEDYSILREKVIGVSFNFGADVGNVFDEIIKSKYLNQNKKYYDFLIESKNHIVPIIELNENNLRNLLFFLEHFKIIFKGLINFFENDTLLKDYHSDILIQALTFTLPISIEYKSGKLIPTYFEEIKRVYLGGIFSISALIIDDGSGNLDRGTKDNEKTYPESYEEKYLNKIDQKTYMFYDSIFNYITGTETFKLEGLIEEVKKGYSLEDGKMPEREKIIDKLSYWRCLDFSLPEYRALTNLMLSFMDKGEYHLNQYLTIFHYSIRFNNILNFDLKELIKRFKKGIGKGKFEYQHNLGFYLSPISNSEFVKELEVVRNYCLQVNDQIKNFQERDELDSLFTLFTTNMEEFLDTVNHPNKHYRVTAIFTKFNLPKFWTTLKRAKNSELILFGHELNRRYAKHIPRELYPEKDFLENLKGKIEVEMDKQKTRKLDKIALEFVLQKVNESLGNFQ